MDIDLSYLRNLISVLREEGVSSYEGVDGVKLTIIRPPSKPYTHDVTLPPQDMCPCGHSIPTAHAGASGCLHGCSAEQCEPHLYTKRE